MVSFSIITPTLNRAALLTEAIQSVLNQDCDDLEHIIVDNGSEDNTIEIVEEFRRQHGHIKLLTEPVKNMARAFNAGLRAAKGDICIWLSDDDLLPPKILRRIADMFHDDEIDIIAGGVRLLEESDKGWRTLKDIYPRCTIYDLLFHTPYEPSKFVSRKIIKRVGLLNENYSGAAHREWLLRMVFAGAIVKHINEVVYILRMHKNSYSLNSDPFRFLKWIPNHLDVAKEYLSKARNNKEKKLLKTWSNRQAIFGFKLALKKRNIRMALSIMGKGLSNDPILPLYWYSRFIMRRLSARFSD